MTAGRFRGRIIGQTVRRVGLLRLDFESFNPDIDFGELEAGGFDVEVEP
jgi:hypothetical protein